VQRLLHEIWRWLTCKAVYHVSPQRYVASIEEGIDPGDNSWTQYGRGFYTFARRTDAEKWQRLRPLLLEIDEAHVILTFYLPHRVWRRLRRKVVPDEVNWNVPAEWLEEFDILEGLWGVTPETSDLQEVWQFKFNPHTYDLLNDALERGAT
jgi:hypothetical protein